MGERLRALRQMPELRGLPRRRLRELAPDPATTAREALAATAETGTAFEALGHSLGVARLWACGRSSLGPPLLASYGETFARPVAVDWAVLAGFTALFLALTCAVLVRRTGR